MHDEMAAAIEKFFLADGKWELDITPEDHPNAIPGRWLWLSDANYGFRPIDLAEALSYRSVTEAKENPVK